MTDVGYLPVSILPYLQEPSLSMVMFAKFDFDRGATVRRFNLGVGTRYPDGNAWQGFEGPDQLQMISIGEIKHPEVNVATAVEIKISGLTSEFLKAVRDDAKIIYGSKASFYVQLYDTSTYQRIGDLNLIFAGRCGQPAMLRDANGTRTMALKVDSDEASKNFSPGGTLSDADQKARYAGDRIGELMGSTALELWK